MGRSEGEVDLLAIRHPGPHALSVRVPLPVQVWGMKESDVAALVKQLLQADKVGVGWQGLWQPDGNTVSGPPGSIASHGSPAMEQQAVAQTGIKDCGQTAEALASD